MNYYISDTHFGHANVIKYDGRPFKSVEEMDNIMINNWNSRVTQDDTVYLLGDLCLGNGDTAEKYLNRLMGHKVLIIGNHDGKLIRSDARKRFDQIRDIMEITDKGNRIIMCHYPMCDWKNCMHGSYLIYGHIHNNTEKPFQYMASMNGQALNAASCINNYMPVTFEELKANNRQFAKANGFDWAN